MQADRLNRRASRAPGRSGKRLKALTMGRPPGNRSPAAVIGSLLGSSRLLTCSSPASQVTVLHQSDDGEFLAGMLSGTILLSAPPMLARRTFPFTVRVLFRSRPHHRRTTCRRRSRCPAVVPKRAVVDGVAHLHLGTGLAGRRGRERWCRCCGTAARQSRRRCDRADPAATVGVHPVPLLRRSPERVGNCPPPIRRRPSLREPTGWEDGPTTGNGRGGPTAVTTVAGSTWSTLGLKPRKGDTLGWRSVSWYHLAPRRLSAARPTADVIVNAAVSFLEQLGRATINALPHPAPRPVAGQHVDSSTTQHGAHARHRRHPADTNARPAATTTP